MLNKAKYKKYEENYVKAHHNQIALNQWKRENLKSSLRKKTHYKQSNKDKNNSSFH